MTDDLVKRLRDRGVCSLAHNSCQNDIACEQAANRIEALEARLSVAMGALGAIKESPSSGSRHRLQQIARDTLDRLRDSQQNKSPREDMMPMVNLETMTVKVEYDMKAVKTALRQERQWYLAAFEQIEPCLEWMFAESPAEDTQAALNVCRNRINALKEDLG